MIKNILVTGGAGYIGSHIIEILIKKNKNVFIIDNLTTGYKKLINKKAKFFKLDILNTIKLKEIIEKNSLKIMYISLNGISSIENLEHKLFLHFIPKLGKNQNDLVKSITNISTNIANEQLNFCLEQKLQIY